MLGYVPNMSSIRMKYNYVMYVVGTYFNPNYLTVTV